MAEEGGNEAKSGSGKLGKIKLSSPSKWFLFFKCALLAWLALFLIDILILYIQPRLYLGRVRLQIMADSNAYEVFPENRIRQGGFPYTAIADQMQIITSKETLYDVIEELQLVKKWDDAKSPADAYGMLLNKLEAEPIEGTSMIDIEIFHTDPQEAADLANAIGQAYRNRRNQNERSRAHNALDMLNAQETLQEQKVEDARQRMIELMEKFDIVDLDPSGRESTSPEVTQTSRRGTLIDALAAFHQKRREAVDLQTRVDAVQNLEGDLRLAWLLKADLLPVVARKSHSESAQLEAHHALLIATGLVSESDPEIVDLKKKIEAHRQIARGGADSALSLLALEKEIAGTALENHASMVDSLRDDMLSERKRYTQYAEAKSAYLAQNRILKDMRTELLKQKVNLSLPRNPIEIHENAEANEVPALPRVPLKIAMSSAVNLLWAIPGGLILMYFAMAYSARRNRIYVHPDEIAEAIELDTDEVESGESRGESAEDNW